MDLAHDTPSLLAVELVDVELAMQVIRLVLKDPGKLARSRHRDLLLVEIHARQHSTGRAVPEGANARNGQAGLDALSVAG